MLSRTLAIIAGALLCASAQAWSLLSVAPSNAAAPIDSGIAARYAGGGWSCDLIPTVIQPASQRALVWDCTSPAGVQMYGGAWGPACPTAFTVALLQGGGQSAGIAIDSATTASITVRIGAHGAVQAGGGTPITLTRGAALAVPQSYSCGSVAPRKL